MGFNNTQSTVEYTTVDLNAVGATTLYDPDTDARVSGVYQSENGSTAEAQLEVTDGTDTVVMTVSGAGGRIEFGDTVWLDGEESLQMNVTTGEGGAQTTTVAVFVSE